MDVLLLPKSGRMSEMVVGAMYIRSDQKASSMNQQMVKWYLSEMGGLTTPISTHLF
jgi:hypothetical protein